MSEEDIYSKYTADADKDSVPSFEEALRSRKQKYVWPDFLGRDTDSSEDLERLSIPGLWIFSDNDAGIPVDISIEGLNALRRKGPSLRLRSVLGPWPQQYGPHFPRGDRLD